MSELVDRRFGAQGKGFLLYAIGPVFFAGLFFYLVNLCIQAIVRGGGFDEVCLLFGSAVVVAIFFVADFLAVYEARRTIHKAELTDGVIHFTPLWGRTFESSHQDIKIIRSSRSFGYVPGVSLIDNNRPNIEIIFRDRPSIFIFGSSEADEWVAEIAKNTDTEMTHSIK